MHGERPAEDVQVGDSAQRAGRQLEYDAELITVVNKQPDQKPKPPAKIDPYSARFVRQSAR